MHYLDTADLKDRPTGAAFTQHDGRRQQGRTSWAANKPLGYRARSCTAMSQESELCITFSQVNISTLAHARDELRAQRDSDEASGLLRAEQKLRISALGTALDLLYSAAYRLGDIALQEKLSLLAADMMLKRAAAGVSGSAHAEPSLTAANAVTVALAVCPRAPHHTSADTPVSGTFLHDDQGAPKPSATRSEYAEERHTGAASQGPSASAQRVARARGKEMARERDRAHHYQHTHAAAAATVTAPTAPTGGADAADSRRMQDRLQRHRDEQQQQQQRRRRQQQLEQKQTQQREKWQQQRRRFRKRADMKRNTSPPAGEKGNIVGSSESPEVWRSVVDRANNYSFRSAPGPQMSVTRDPAAHRLAHERRKKSIAFGNHHASAHARTSFN